MLSKISKIFGSISLTVILVSLKSSVNRNVWRGGAAMAGIQRRFSAFVFSSLFFCFFILSFIMQQVSDKKVFGFKCNFI